MSWKTKLRIWTAVGATAIALNFGGVATPALAEEVVLHMAVPDWPPTHIMKDLFAGIRDIVGGRSQAYEQELAKAREIALREMEEQARSPGANAIIGMDLDYETVGSGGAMLMVSASGTAVKI